MSGRLFRAYRNIDGFSRNDGRGRSVQDFITGQHVLSELHGLSPTGLMVIGPVSYSASPSKDIDSDHEDSVSIDCSKPSSPKNHSTVSSADGKSSGGTQHESLPSR